MNNDFTKNVVIALTAMVSARQLVNEDTEQFSAAEKIIELLKEMI